MRGVRAFFRSLAAEVLPRCPCADPVLSVDDLPPPAGDASAAGEDGSPVPPSLEQESARGWMRESEEQLLARREQLVLGMADARRRLEEAQAAQRVAQAGWLSACRDLQENDLRLSLLPVRRTG